MAKAAIYGRVSTVEQEDGYSIDSQVELMRDYANQNDLEIVREFLVAESAKQTGRKEFGQLCAFLEDNPECELIVEKVDRLVRNLSDAAKVQELGVNVHFVKENLNLHDGSTSTDKFVYGIKATVATYFIDNLKEEVGKGMMTKARQGHFPGYAPIGFLNTTDGIKKFIVQDPERAGLVARLYREVAAERLSLSAAIAFASEIGLRTRKGNRLSKTTVHRILTNEFYVGRFYWEGECIDGAHEPLIDELLFDEVQSILNGRASRTGVYGSKQFALRGLIECAGCGRKLSPERKKGQAGNGNFVY